MVAIRLREAMAAYKRRTGERITYEILAGMTGIAKGTLHHIGSRDDYNASLATVEKLCLSLDVPLHDLLEMIPDPPKKKAEGKNSKKRNKAAK